MDSANALKDLLPLMARYIANGTAKMTQITTGILGELAKFALIINLCFKSLYSQLMIKLFAVNIVPTTTTSILKKMANVHIVVKGLKLSQVKSSVASIAPTITSTIVPQQTVLALKQILIKSYLNLMVCANFVQMAHMNTSEKDIAPKLLQKATYALSTRWKNLKTIYLWVLLR